MSSNKPKPSFRTSFLKRFQFKPAALERSESTNKREIADGETPRNEDVICGRGKATQDHPGNKRYREIIKENLKEYMNAKTKMDKSLVVSKVVDQIHEDGGNFVKKNAKTKKWGVVDEDFAREKTAHTIRDTIRSLSPSEGTEKKSEKDEPVCEVFTEKASTLLDAQRNIFMSLQPQK